MLEEVSVKIIEIPLIYCFLTLSAIYLIQVAQSCRWYRKMKNIGGVLIGKGKVVAGGSSISNNVVKVGGITNEEKEKYKKEGFVDVGDFFKYSMYTNIIGAILGLIGFIFTFLFLYL